MNEITYKKDGILINDNFISLSEIIKKCSIAKIKEESLLLLKMKWRSRRGFDGISEEIVLSKDKIDIIKSYILGRNIDFGEINGKHSDVYGTLDDNDIEIIEDVEIISNFLSLNTNGHVYNHSFLFQFLDDAREGVYDDISEDDVLEFQDCLL